VANRYELPLDILQLTGISTTDGISQSNVHCNLGLSDVQHGVVRLCREEQLKLMV